MGSTDNFCLRWNDFESNISSSFRELRKDSEFFDVTLCCDNGTDRLSAHKVILAACSPLFRRILQNNAAPNPLLYLKGIQKKELTAILNFMYHGEVNVAQDSLNAFLAVAEELAVKGLTTDTKPDGFSMSSSAHDATEVEGENEQRKSAKKQGKVRKHSGDVAEGDVKRVKAEPDVLLGDGTEGGGATGGPDFAEDFAAEGFDDTYGNYDDLEENAGLEGSGGAGEVTKVREEASFLRSKRGNAMLVDSSGYHYFVNKKRETRMYWKCLKCRSHGCRARAVTEGFYIVSKTAEHSHEPSSTGTNSFGAAVEFV